MPEQLRMGIVGCGRMGARHVETAERLDSLQVVAVADSDEAAARECVGRRPIDIMGDWRALLERDDLDAVTVAAPSELHAEIGLAALDAGKHVLVEKPLATTMPEALRLAAAARTAGRKLMVGHVERFNPAVGKLAALVAEGRIGQVFRAHAERVGPLPARIRDAGVAIDLATHDLDIMQHLLAHDITHVYAEGARFSHATDEDMLTCLLRFGDDGPYGLLDVNWLTPEKRRELTIIGEGGMLRASYLTQEVWFTESAGMFTAWDELARVRGDAEGSVLRFALPKREPLRAELEAWAECVLEDGPEPVSAWEGARALAAALAVRESAAHCRPVELLDMPHAPTPSG